MAHKITDLNIDYIVKEYTGGRGAQSIANELGVSVQTIMRRLGERGIKYSRETRLPSGEIVERYKAGESILALAKRFDIARNSIERRLVMAGVKLRTQSEAEAVRWGGMTKDQRRAQVKAAHDAVRGSKRPVEERLKTAATRERLNMGGSSLESDFARMLADRGIVTVPQKAIGPYNCDLAAHPVAVEIFGGQWHFSGRHLARAEKRIRYLFDAGWHVFAVVHTKEFPIGDGAADEAAAYINFMQRNPAMVRQYRMIRGTGDYLGSSRADGDKLSLIPAFANARDARNGRYKRVLR